MLDTPSDCSFSLISLSSSFSFLSPSPFFLPLSIVLSPFFLSLSLTSLHLLLSFSHLPFTFYSVAFSCLPKVPCSIKYKCKASTTNRKKEKHTNFIKYVWETIKMLVAKWNRLYNAPIYTIYDMYSTHSDRSVMPMVVDWIWHWVLVITRRDNHWLAITSCKLCSYLHSFQSIKSIETEVRLVPNECSCKNESLFWCPNGRKNTLTHKSAGRNGRWSHYKE